MNHLLALCEFHLNPYIHISIHVALNKMHMVSLVVGTISYNQATSTIQHACILKLKGLQRLFLGYIASLQIYSFRVKQWKFRLKIIDCWKVWRVALHPGNEPFVSIVWIPFESNHCNDWCQVIGNQGGLTDINIQQFSVPVTLSTQLPEWAFQNPLTWGPPPILTLPF